MSLFICVCACVCLWLFDGVWLKIVSRDVFAYMCACVVLMYLPELILAITISH